MYRRRSHLQHPGCPVTAFYQDLASEVSVHSLFQETSHNYIFAVKQFAEYLGKSPEN
jgi:hypothetical protein